MLEPVRLVTVHPALVHFALGALPLLILTYALAVRRRSERWAFAGDVTLAVTAASTLLAASFGLVSNAVVDWPGGLGLWRWLHIGLGLSSALLLSALAVVRLARRRRHPVPGAGTLAAAVLVAAIMGATGWVGGEVLVFHAGMAVRAAGDGGLAPPVTRPRRPPRDLLDAMHQLRGSWGALHAQLVEMLVEVPRPGDYEALGREAREMSRVARWLHGEKPRAEETPFLRWARTLEQHADRVHTAAGRGALEEILVDTGRIDATCAACHRELRWEEEVGPAKARPPRTARAARPLTPARP
jgi:uncharacterized membrane protein